MLSIVAVGLTLAASACASRTIMPTASAGAGGASNEADLAQVALEEFFAHLSESEYSQAAELYAGSYRELAQLNPSLKPDDHVELLAAACTLNGYQCLRVGKAVLLEQLPGPEYRFGVEFQNPDGTLYIRGPCCGADATDEPPASQFAFSVRKTAHGRFAVLDLPVYAP